MLGIIITIYLLFTLVILGPLCGVCNSTACGLEFVNPLWLYKTYRLNWFGAVLLCVLLNVLSLPWAICYWIYVLCTVGRKE